MRFVYPWVLLLLSLVPLVGLLWVWLAARALRRLGDLVAPPLQPRLAPPRQAWRGTVQIVLALSGLTLMLVAAARPQWGQRSQQVYTRGRNLLIALDVSRSMLAQDVHPNRLERAKVDILDLIAELRGDRAGLMVFRGKALLLCPLTTDTAFMRQIVDGVAVDSAPRGATDLAHAIRRGLEALEPALDDHNAILLITDGEELTGHAVEAAREAGQRGVPIFTVGLGDPAGAPLPAADGKGVQQDRQGRPVSTRLMDATLEAIARESGGAYIPLATAGTAHTTLGSIYRQHLRRVAAREQQERIERRYIERYQLFLIPAVVLLGGVGLLSRGRFGSARRRGEPGTPPPPSRPRVWPAAAPPPPLPAGVAPGLARLLAVGLLLPLAAADAATDASAPPFAEPASTTNAPGIVVPPGRVGARQAQSWFRRGRHREAGEAYLSAARGAEADEAATYRYNAGIAFSRGGDPARAAEVLAPVSRLPGQDTAAELYGACQLQLVAACAATDTVGRAAALELAGAGFQHALRAAPEDARRRRNLARVLAPLPAARDEAHLARVLQEFGKVPPDQLLTRMLREQRALVAETPVALTNAVPLMIPQLEALADRQERQADLWIPLKQALLQSPGITNEQQRAMAAQLVETSRDTMKQAAARLRDLDSAGLQDAARSEPVIYDLWRQSSAPPPLLDEAIDLQSNALARADQPRFPLRPDQPEVASLAKLFAERFPAWADQVVAQAQADTNAPTLTPEARAEIESLSAETLALLERAGAEREAVTRRPFLDQALTNLWRIRDLLPKQNQSPQSQPNAQPQEKPESPPPQPPPDQPQENEAKQPPPEEAPKPKDEVPPDVQEMLRRALQREKEHADDVRRQTQQIPMQPDEQDW